jgi:hypothetical protein
MNGIADVTATDAEWAEDMLGLLAVMENARFFQTMTELSDEQIEVLRAFIAQEWWAA